VVSNPAVCEAKTQGRGPRQTSPSYLASENAREYGYDTAKRPVAVTVIAEMNFLAGLAQEEIALHFDMPTYADKARLDNGPCVITAVTVALNPI
jgi:hypothetical protein